MMLTFTVAVVAALVVQSSLAQHPMENEGLFEGDIIGIDPYGDRNSVVDEAKLWPEGIVYYEVDSRLSSIHDLLMEAIKEYETKTCLKFHKRTAATGSYIYITMVSGCSSSVGRTGGPQRLSLSRGCHYKGTIIHELGHAIGLWHEHSRSDREDYIEIIWDNLIDGAKFNFQIMKPWENNLLGEKFDYKSIMLYGEYTFAKARGAMTIKPKQKGIFIGDVEDKTGLSDSDVRRINKLYQCFGAKRPPPPDVPDFKCDFEDGSMCDFQNEINQRAYWEIAEGTLGGRSGKYLMVTKASASSEKIKLFSPAFKSYGRKKACFSFDIYSSGDGSVYLGMMVQSIHKADIIMKHVDEKDVWKRIQVGADLDGNVKVSLDVRTQETAVDGIIAVDNFLYQLHDCA